MIRLASLACWSIALGTSLLWAPTAHAEALAAVHSSPAATNGVAATMGSTETLRMTEGERGAPNGKGVPPASSPASPPEELRELWTGGVYASTFRVGICIRPDGEARGVLLLRVPSGNVDVYHFYGRRDTNGVITLQHSSGHSFTGGFVDESTVRGTGLLRNGLKATLQGSRTRNARLSQDTCRPLD